MVKRFCFVALLLHMIFLYGCGDGGGGSWSGLPEWTIVVFMNDSDVNARELAGIDIYEMRRVGSTDHVKIIVQRVSETGRGMVRYLVEKGNLKLLDVLPDASSTSSEALLSLFNWCVENYSAEKYALILWERGHKDIWEGMVEWVNLVKAFSSLSSKIDLLVFDSSAKAELELLDEVKNYASVVVALQGVMPDDGFDYEEILSKVVKNPSCGSTNFGSYFFDSFKNLYSQRNDVAISVISLAKLSNLLTCLDDLGTDLLNFNDTLALWMVIAQVQPYFISPGESPCFKDLYDFCEKIGSLNVGESTKKKIESLKKSIKEAVLYEWHPTNGIFRSSHGLSLYIYSLEGKEGVYDSLAIAEDARSWYEFIKTKLGR